MRILFTTLPVLALLMAATAMPAHAQRPVDYVNPVIGTDGMGHTFPGACAPFGIVQLSPDNDTIPHNVNGKYQPRVYEYCAGYQHADNTLVGFSHTHFSGTGHSDLGDILVMPGTGQIRLNPGNLSGEDRVRQVAEAAGNANIPIRVGANAGSVRPELLEKYGLAEALTRSALDQCAMLEKYGFSAIKVSLKASDVPATVAACRCFAERSDLPLHIGVTEAGTPARGVIKSAVGIGALLLDGIGDTIRVSLTADPVEEVRAGIHILESCGLRSAAPEIVSCPTCGRTRIDLAGLAEKVESLVDGIKRGGGRIGLAKIAVMGCIVNGPGEARDADIGLAGGDGKVVVFRRGEPVGTFGEAEGFAFLREEILKHTEQ